MHSSEPILRVQNLAVHRCGSSILRSVSWTVEAGQHWVLLGANGSGKTSLLKAVTGYLMPSSGSIELLGLTFGETDWRDLRRRVGMVSSAVSLMIPDDEPALNTVSSGRTAVIGCWNDVVIPDRATARRLLTQLGCSRLADRPWGVLSQGERQRILIARALVARPDLLILDEPCAGLDPVAREHFLQFLNRLGRQPRAPALILVTHHVEEIMPVFSHVLVLKRGRILSSGPKKTVLNSKVMSDAFEGGAKILKTAGGRYLLKVAGRSSGIV